jgi:hypothetical protein
MRLTLRNVLLLWEIGNAVRSDTRDGARLAVRV